MTNLILIAILAAIIGGASFYIYRSKKNGVKCIGCPQGCKISSSEKVSGGCGGMCSGCQSGCSCHAETQ